LLKVFETDGGMLNAFEPRTICFKNAPNLLSITIARWLVNLMNMKH